MAKAFPVVASHGLPGGGACHLLWSCMEGLRAFGVFAPGWCMHCTKIEAAACFN